MSKIVPTLHGEPTGLFRDNGKENGNCYIIIGLHRGYIGIMEKKMEAIFRV